MERRHVIWAGALLAAALVWTMGAGLAERAGDFDMVGMLKEIDQTNTEIGQVNAGILTSLGNVQQQAQGVERVYRRLARLHLLVKEQQAELDKLRLTTAEQVALSRDLKELTAGVGPATAGLSRTAAAEAAAVERMSRNTALLAAHLREIGRANRSTAGKLERAEGLSALILGRMP